MDWIDSATIMMGTPGFVQLAKAQMAQFERRGFQLPITDEERKGLLNMLGEFDLTKHTGALDNRPDLFLAWETRCRRSLSADIQFL